MACACQLTGCRHGAHAVPLAAAAGASPLAAAASAPPSSSSFCPVSLDMMRLQRGRGRGARGQYKCGRTWTWHGSTGRAQGARPLPSAATRPCSTQHPASQPQPIPTQPTAPTLPWIGFHSRVQDESHLCALIRFAALAGGDAVQHRRVHAQLALAQVIDVLVHSTLGDQAVHLWYSSGTAVGTSERVMGKRGGPAKGRGGAQASMLASVTTLQPA